MKHVQKLSSMDIHFNCLLLLVIAALPMLVNAAPPNAIDDVRSVPVDTPITIDVLNNDSDPDGDAIEILVEGWSEPANGTLEYNDDGSFFYQPNPGFIGTDSFGYTIADSSEAQETASATVFITVSDGGIASRPNAINARGVAAALDQICSEVENSGEGELPSGILSLINNCQRLQELFLLDPEAAQDAVRQIAPEETLGLLKTGGNANEFQSEVVSQRITQLTLNSPTLASSGLSWSGTLPGAGAGDQAWSNIGVFGSVQLENANKDSTGYETGYKNRTNGFTLGADYALNADWYSGAAIGLTKNSMDYVKNGGSNNSDVYTLMAFSTYHANNFSFDVQAGFGTSKIDISRNISYGYAGYQFNSRTRGKTNGSQWFLKAKTQYLWSRGALTIYPSLSYSVSNSRVDEYAEVSGGGWDVLIGEQNARQQTLEAAFQATYVLNQSWGVLIPTFEFRSVADLDTDHSILQASFAYAPTGSAGFALYGEPPQSVFHVAGLGVSSVLPNGGNAFVNVNRTLSYDYYSATQLQLGFRFEY